MVKKSTGTDATVHAVRSMSSGACERASEGLFQQVSEAVLEVLPRSDQRRAGAEYLHGLLEADGRKSARNLAAHSRGQANEQSLHHFVNASSWDWSAARRALAHRVTESWTPSVWVARPVVIPKSGAGAVGVNRRFVPALGRAVNAQQVVGLWVASPSVNCPVNWRIHLTGSWLADACRRSRCAVPETARAESLHECLVETVLETATAWGLESRPVVLDARGADVGWALRRLRAAGLSVLVRVDPEQRLVSPPGPRDSGRRIATAGELHRVLRGTRRTAAPWVDRGEDGAMSAGVVVAAGRVMLADGLIPAQRSAPVPGTAAAAGTASASGAGNAGMSNVTPIGRRPAARRVGPSAPEEFSLLAIEERGCAEPQLWLTDLADAPLLTLFRMSTLIQQVDADYDRIGDRVGLRDFTGRSYAGWHRHATLASAAYAVEALTRAHRQDRAAPRGGRLRQLGGLRAA